VKANNKEKADHLLKKKKKKRKKEKEKKGLKTATVGPSKTVSA
jgi:hypothetical protein